MPHIRLLPLPVVFIALSCLNSAVSPAADVFNPQNGHYYRLSGASARWDTAHYTAMFASLDGMHGHLLTITSPEEDEFIRAQFGSITLWLGGLQPEGSPEPSGNWQWVTGEPFVYTNWASPAEPNNVFDENRIERFPPSSMRPTGAWNDIGIWDGRTQNWTLRPFIIEFTPGIEPSLDGRDFLAWQRGFGTRGPYIGGDLNGDRSANTADLQWWTSVFGGQGGVTAVPEPGSGALAWWLMGFLHYRRRFA